MQDSLNLSSMNTDPFFVFKLMVPTGSGGGNGIEYPESGIENPHWFVFHWGQKIA